MASNPLRKEAQPMHNSSNCYTCSEHPTLRWWPELQLPSGRVVYNMAALGEDASEWFMLEFAGQPSRNSAAARLASRRIFVPEDRQQRGTFPSFVREKAAEWLAPSDDQPWSFPPARNATAELLDEVKKLTSCVAAILEGSHLAV